MFKNFYYLYFKCIVDKEDNEKSDYSEFNLGYYSTKKKAREKIELYKDLPGFKDYPIKCFKIKRKRVDIKYAEKQKGNYVLYELTHEYYDEDKDRDYDSCFELFSTKEYCKKKIQRLVKKKKYRKYPNNFCIGERIIDNCQEWIEGFYVVDSAK